MIVNSLNLDHLGVILDIGHSLMALENPAESAVLLHRHGRLFNVHWNDNYRDWDQDMIPGTVNLWETIELFYWLQRLNFDGWYGIDIYPYREDGFGAVSQTIKNMKRFDRIARKLQGLDIPQIQEKQDGLRIIELMMQKILQDPD